MDNLRNGGDNGRTYPCTIDGVNSFYVNTTSQNSIDSTCHWTDNAHLKNRDITNYSSMKLNYVASDQCNSFYGSGLDKNNTWMKITNKDTKISFYIQSMFI